MKLSVKRDLKKLQDQALERFNATTSHVRNLKVDLASQVLEGREPHKVLVSEAKLRKISVEDLAQMILEAHDADNEALLAQELDRQRIRAAIRGAKDEHALIDLVNAQGRSLT